MSRFTQIFAVVFALGCTENDRAKNYGGTAQITLVGKKLVNVTWKDDDMWVLTRQLHESDPLETYEFQEHSSWGVAEGTVIIIESR